MNQNTPGDRIDRLSAVVGTECSFYFKLSFGLAGAQSDTIVLARVPGYIIGFRTLNFMLSGSEWTGNPIDGEYECLLYHATAAWTQLSLPGLGAPGLPLNTAGYQAPTRTGISGYYRVPAQGSIRHASGTFINRPFIARQSEDIRLRFQITNNGAGGGDFKLHCWGEWVLLDTKDVAPAW